MLIELRSTGAQTVFPNSTHKETGELIEWLCDNGPTEIDGAELTRLGGLVAGSALIARYWPVHARHEASLALAGALRHSGWSLEQTEIFVKAVVEAAGDEEATDRIRAARDTFASKKPTTGWPRLAEMLGEPIIGRLRDWLGVRREPRQEPPIGEEPPQLGNGADFSRTESPGKTETAPDKRIFHDTDFANARRLAKLHGADLRFTPERGWIVWSGARWVPDDQGHVMELAKDAAKSVFDEIRDADEAAQGELFKWARRSQSIERARAMLTLTQSEPGIPAHWTAFDADPWALHFVNGALNLEC
jgi:D5 N terminal like